MYVTLERNGIELPAGFKPSAIHFQPQRSLSTRTLSQQEADKALVETRTWVARSVPGNHTPLPNSAPTLSGFSSTEKGVAFFVGLMALAIAADKAGGGSNSSDSGPTGPLAPSPQLWWQQAGYVTYGQAMRAVCFGNTTSAHPNC